MANKYGCTVDMVEREMGASIPGVSDGTWVKFRTCSAETWDDGTFVWLKSYNTVVAAYHKDSNTVYDFLRVVYGYTATSSQHVGKFYHDMRFHEGFNKNYPKFTRYYG